MKFVALLLFVGVTSATWCWEDNADTCPGENGVHGKATTACCDQVDGEGDSDQFNRGCDIIGDTMHDSFFDCCTSKPWSCSRTMN